MQHESGEPTMKESGNHDEIVGEYNVNFGRENNPPSHNSFKQNVVRMEKSMQIG